MLDVLESRHNMAILRELQPHAFQPLSCRFRRILCALHVLRISSRNVAVHFASFPRLIRDGGIYGSSPAVCGTDGEAILIATTIHSRDVLCHFRQ